MKEKNLHSVQFFCFITEEKIDRGVFCTQKEMNLTQFVEAFSCVQEWTIHRKSRDVLVISFLLGPTTLFFPCFLGKQKLAILIMAVSGTLW